MSTLSLPTLTRSNATRVTFTLAANTQSFESPLNKTVQTYELPGARWMVTLTWENLLETDARILKAWLAKLRGAAGRFYCGDLSHKTPAGLAVGSGTVSGSNQTGTSIITAWGAHANCTGWLVPGDYVSIAGELKIITQSIPLTTGPLATLVFEPPMRAAPANAAAVVIASPTAVFRLLDDKQDVMEFNPERTPTVTISGVEVFT